ncbi:hypothetical protein KPH14_002306 [Odynerus spinipes]|uniref:Uncharacterized protein n=1 Tax=Odynerus spinipes TaxID=1348599 RepID=A0AAD9VQ07_9HYME|nr:hypothetical protein KPH14_002306 [Odynerus spinipes]
MTSSCLVVFLLACSNIFVLAEPEPLPAGMIYSGESFSADPESLVLLNRLKQLSERKQEIIEQERELTEEQLAIQAMLEARDQRVSQNDYSQEDAEVLPVPSAIVHHSPLGSVKRTTYMSLCHFKICNMGRKRTPKVNEKLIKVLSATDPGNLLVMQKPKQERIFSRTEFN